MTDNRYEIQLEVTGDAQLKGLESGLVRAATAAERLDGQLRDLGGAIEVSGGDPFAALEAGAIRLDDTLGRLGASDPLRGLESGLRQSAAEVGLLDSRLRDVGATIRLAADAPTRAMETGLGRAAAEARRVGAIIDEALRLQLTGLDSGLHRAAADAGLLVRAEHELAAAGDQAAKGQQSLAQAEDRVAQSAGRAATAAGGVASAGRAAGDAANHAGRGAGNAALGFLEVSRAVEDAQYGLRGVINNIPTAVMLFGGGAGLAGGISLVAVGVNVLVNNFDTLKDRFQAHWSGQTVEQLKEIRETAEEAAEAFKKLEKAAPKAKEEEAKIVSEAITEGPTKDITERFTKAIRNSSMGIKVKEEAPQAGIMAPGVIPRAGKTRAEADAEEKEANRKKAADLIGSATIAGAKGDPFRKTLEDLARLSGDPKLREFIDKLKKATPEAQEAKKADEANREVSIKGREALKAGRLKREDAAVDDLMKSDIARKMLAPGAQGKPTAAFVPDMERALKDSGTTGVDAASAVRELRRRLEEQAQKKVRQNGGDMASGRRALLDDLDAPAIRERERQQKEKEREDDKRRRERERRTSQVVGAMDESPMARAMLMGVPGAGSLDSMEKSLKRAGATDVNPLAALTELKSKLNEKIEAKSLEKGVDPTTARAMVLEDSFKKGDMKEDRGHASFTGVADFAKKMQTDILNDDTPKKSLGELQVIRQILQSQKSKGATPLVAS